MLVGTFRRTQSGGGSGCLSASRASEDMTVGIENRVESLGTVHSRNRMILVSESHECIIGLGSNLQSPVWQVAQAIKRISAVVGWRVLQVSSFYESRPMMDMDHPKYINAAVAVSVACEPIAVLQQLLQIESDMGRMRPAAKWSPRCIDLDLLLMGDIKLVTAELVLPHPGIAEREFVLAPLAELKPKYVLNTGQTVAAVLQSLPMRGLRRLSEVEQQKTEKPIKQGECV